MTEIQSQKRSGSAYKSARLIFISSETIPGVEWGIPSFRLYTEQDVIFKLLGRYLSRGHGEKM